VPHVRFHEAYPFAFGAELFHEEQPGGSAILPERRMLWRLVRIELNAVMWMRYAMKAPVRS